MERGQDIKPLRRGEPDPNGAREEIEEIVQETLYGIPAKPWHGLLVALREGGIVVNQADLDAVPMNLEISDELIDAVAEQNVGSLP